MADKPKPTLCHCVSVPRTCLLECLELYKFNKAFIQNLVGLWKTIAQVKGGIYQGDAQSPLLHCIGLNFSARKRLAMASDCEIGQP